MAEIKVWCGRVAGRLGGCGAVEERWGVVSLEGRRCGGLLWMRRVSLDWEFQGQDTAC